MRLQNTNRKLRKLIFSLILFNSHMAIYAESPSAAKPPESTPAQSAALTLKRKNTAELIRRVIAHPQRMGLPEDLANALRIGDPLAVVQRDYDEKCQQVIEETEYTQDEGKTLILGRSRIDLESPAIPVVGMQVYGGWDEKVGWGWKTQVKEQLTTVLVIRTAETRAPIKLRQGKGYLESDGNDTVECDVSGQVSFDKSEGTFSFRDIEAGAKGEAGLPVIGGKVSGKFGGLYQKDRNVLNACVRKATTQFGSAQIWLPKGNYPIEFLTNLCREYGNIVKDFVLEAQRTNKILTHEMMLSEEACDAKRKCSDLTETEKSEITDHWMKPPNEPKKQLLYFSLEQRRGGNAWEKEKTSREEYNALLKQYKHAEEILRSSLERICQYHPVEGGMRSKCDIVLKPESACFKPPPKELKEANRWKRGDLYSLSIDQLRSRYLGHRWNIPCRADTECWDGQCRSNEDIRKIILAKYDTEFGSKKDIVQKLQSAKHAYTSDVQKIIADERKTLDSDGESALTITDGRAFECRQSLINAIEHFENQFNNNGFFGSTNKKNMAYVESPTTDENGLFEGKIVNSHIDSLYSSKHFKILDGQDRNPYGQLRGCNPFSRSPLKFLTYKKNNGDFKWNGDEKYYLSDFDNPMLEKAKASANAHCSIWAIKQSQDSSGAVCRNVKNDNQWRNAHCLNHYQSDFKAFNSGDRPDEKLCVQYCNTWLEACCGNNPPPNCSMH